MAPDFRISITIPERDLMLRVLKLSPALEGRLRFALMGPECLELSLTGEQPMELCLALQAGIPTVKKRKEQDMLVEFLMGLLDFLDDTEGEEDDFYDGDDEEMPDFDPAAAYRARVQEAIASGEFQNEMDLRAELERIGREHNNAPMPDRCGLSPAQCFDLISIEWNDPRCPLRFNTNLPVEALEHCPWVHAALKLIELIDAGGGLPLTPKGQINRPSVRLILEADIFQDINTREMLNDKSIKDEEAVHSLLMLRSIMEEAGLVERRKRKLVVTDAGRNTLKAGPTGELLMLLFGTLFDTMNLGCFDPFPDNEELQDTLGYVFYALQTVAREPIGVIEAAEDAVILRNNEGIPDGLFAELVIVLFIARVLLPLSSFGMVDMIMHEENMEVVTRPLFHEFLTFEFSPVEA